MYPATKNIVVGAGHIYFDEFDTDGNPQGERYLAETPGFSLSVSVETLEDYSSDGAVAEKHLDIPIRTVRDSNVTLKDMKLENFAMFVIGTVSAVTTTSGAVTADPINGGQGVKQGHWYQLGVDNATMPTGVRDITSLVINDGVTPQTITDDYLADLVTGRIYIVPGGGIPNGTVLTADYNEQDRTWSQVASNDLGAKKGALRYVAGNTTGENRDVFLPSTVLKPDGEVQFKSRDTVQQMGFALSVQKPSDGRAAVYVNGRAAA